MKAAIKVRKAMVYIRPYYHPDLSKILRNLYLFNTILASQKTSWQIKLILTYFILLAISRTNFILLCVCVPMIL